MTCVPATMFPVHLADPGPFWRGAAACHVGAGFDEEIGAHRRLEDGGHVLNFTQLIVELMHCCCLHAADSSFSLPGAVT